MFEKFLATLLEVFGIVLKPKVFSTGSKGYFGVAKIVGVDHRRYQVQIQVVEIGSKAAAQAAANPPANPAKPKK